MQSDLNYKHHQNTEQCEYIRSCEKNQIQTFIV